MTDYSKHTSTKFGHVRGDSAIPATPVKPRQHRHKIHFGKLRRNGRVVTFCGVSWMRNITEDDIKYVDCANCLRIAKAQEEKVKP